MDGEVRKTLQSGLIGSRNVCAILSLKEYFVTQEMEKHIDSISFVLSLYSHLLQVAAACLRVASTERYWERSRLVGKDAAEGNGMLHQRNERVVAERRVGQC